MSNEIKSIKQWFELAKPNPTIEDACVQIGCGYEETAERMESLCDDVALDELIDISIEYKSKYEPTLAYLSSLSKHQKIELLDSQCDEIVTRIGEAHMLGFDIIGAINEVITSNYSKFENGKPVFNEQGKIAKGKDYFAPDLSKFIGSTNK